jgi:hypothetical protein
MRKPSSRKIIIITSCCLFATVSFLYKAQYYVLDYTQPITETADDSLDYDVHEEGLDNKSSWSDLYVKYTQYTKEQQQLLSSSSADNNASLQSHHLQNSNSSIKEEEKIEQQVVYATSSRTGQKFVVSLPAFALEQYYQKKMIRRPTNGSPPLFNLPQNQTLCKLNNFEVVCFNNTTRNISIESYPLFAEYYIDGDGTRVMSNRTQSSSSITQQLHHRRRPIATSWFQPNVTKFCDNFTDHDC